MYCTCHKICTRGSPSTAPATKPLQAHQVLRLPRSLRSATPQNLPARFTKRWPCHETCAQPRVAQPILHYSSYATQLTQPIVHHLSHRGWTTNLEDGWMDLVAQLHVEVACFERKTSWAVPASKSGSATCHRVSVAVRTNGLFYANHFA